MYRTLLLMMCSTSCTFANLNNSMRLSGNNTSKKPFSEQDKKPNSEKQLILNDTNLLNGTVTDITAGANLTHPNVTMLNYSIVITEATINQNIMLKIHRTITRSKDAVWATITLTFICVLLLIAVAQSKMWKDYKRPEFQGPPNFDERVLFKDVMEHKIKSLKRIFQKKKKKNATEMKSLLASSDLDDEVDIP